MRVDQITQSEICVILVVTPSHWSEARIKTNARSCCRGDTRHFGATTSSANRLIRHSQHLQDVLAALSVVRAAASSSFFMDRVSVSSWFVRPIHVRDNASGSHGKQYGNATTSASPSPRVRNGPSNTTSAEPSGAARASPSSRVNCSSTGGPACQCCQRDIDAQQKGGSTN